VKIISNNNDFDRIEFYEFMMQKIETESNLLFNIDFLDKVIFVLNDYANKYDYRF